MIRPLLHGAPLAALFLVGACGNLPAPDPIDIDGDSGVDATPDANIDAGIDSGIDAPDAPALCDVSTPWPSPTLLPGIADGLDPATSDLYVWLSGDEKRLYLARGDSPTTMRATRDSVDGTFRAPTEAGLATTGDLSMTADEKTVYGHARRTLAGQPLSFDIFRYASAGPGSSIGGEVRLAYATDDTTVNGEGYDQESFVVPDGSGIYFTSNRGVTSDYGIWYARRFGSEFGVPTRAVPATNAFSATVTADNLVLMYATGDGKVWVASRDDASGTFRAATEVAELRGTATELVYPNWLSADRCRLYLVQQTTNPTRRRVYYTEREPATN
jgi:hypothetical protein